MLWFLKFCLYIHIYLSRSVSFHLSTEYRVIKSFFFSQKVFHLKLLKHFFLLLLFLKFKNSVSWTCVPTVLFNYLWFVLVLNDTLSLDMGPHGWFGLPPLPPFLPFFLPSFQLASSQYPKRQMESVLWLVKHRTIFTPMSLQCNSRHNTYPLHRHLEKSSLLLDLFLIPLHECHGEFCPTP